MRRSMLMAQSKAEFGAVFNYGITDTADANSYSFPAVPLGDSNDRLVVVCLGADATGTAAPTTTSVTVGGVALTKGVETSGSDGANRTYSGIWYGVVSAISSGTVVVTFSKTMIRCSLGVYGVYSSALTPRTTASAQSGLGKTLNLTMASSLAGDLAIANYSASSGGPVSWTGVGMDSEVDNSGVSAVGHSNALSSNAQNITASIPSNAPRQAGTSIAFSKLTF